MAQAEGSRAFAFHTYIIRIKRKEIDHFKRPNKQHFKFALMRRTKKEFASISILSK